MAKNVELLDNANDILYPKTLAVQVAVNANKNLDTKLNEMDTNIESVTNEVKDARTDNKTQITSHKDLKTRLDSDYSAVSNEILETNKRIDIIDENRLKRIYGAKIDGVTDDSDALQKAIDMESVTSSTIYIPDGVLVVEKPLILKSNTHIKMSNGATILKKHTADYFAITETSDSTRGYDGSSNIVIDGGKIKFDGVASSSNGIVLFHANDVVINNVEFENASTHAVDICGSKNVKITNCNFNGYIVSNNVVYRETIQVDCASYGGCPYFDVNDGRYDLTPNDTILISNCCCNSSKDAPAPLNFIGQHAQYTLPKKHNNICIKDNILKGSSSTYKNIGHNGSAIRLMQTDSFEICGNIISGFNRGITLPIYDSVSDANGNEVRDGNNPVTKADGWCGFTHGIISENIITTNSAYVFPGISLHISSNTLKTNNVPTYNMICIGGNVIHATFNTGHSKAHYIYGNFIDGVTIDGNIIWGNGKAESSGIYLGISDYYLDVSTAVTPLLQNATVGITNQFANVSVGNEVVVGKYTGNDVFNYFKNILGKDGGTVVNNIQIKPNNPTDYKSFNISRQHTDGVEYQAFLGLQTKNNGQAVGIQLVKAGAEINRLNIGDGFIEPLNDNTCDLGRSFYRFKDIYATSGVINTSDFNAKKEIKDIDLGLEFINKLHPVNFKFKDNQSDRVHTGLIAQELESVLGDNDKAMLIKSNFVDEETGEDNTVYGIRYAELIAPLIKSVQELSQEIINLKKELDNQKNTSK